MGQKFKRDRFLTALKLCGSPSEHFREVGRRSKPRTTSTYMSELRQILELDDAIDVFHG